MVILFVLVANTVFSHRFSTVCGKQAHFTDMSQQVVLEGASAVFQPSESKVIEVSRKLSIAQRSGRATHYFP
jgi:hypothetical protein